MTLSVSRTIYSVYISNVSYAYSCTYIFVSMCLSVYPSIDSSFCLQCIDLLNSIAKTLWGPWAKFRYNFERFNPIAQGKSENITPKYVGLEISALLGLESTDIFFLECHRTVRASLGTVLDLNGRRCSRSVTDTAYR